jgi:hypothetical protein
MSAVFSPCGLYRLRLDRIISMIPGPTIGFCLHNPSTAGVENDDPTSRRGIGFTKAWGGSKLSYVNPWAGRATNPDDLWRMADPVGPDCDLHIQAVAEECRETGGFMVAAWGAVNPPAAMRASVSTRLRRVADLILATGCELRSLGVTKAGAPRHPLYVRGDTLPVAWPPTPATTAETRGPAEGAR